MLKVGTKVRYTETRSPMTSLEAHNHGRIGTVVGMNRSYPGLVIVDFVGLDSPDYLGRDICLATNKLEVVA